MRWMIAVAAMSLALGACSKPAEEKGATTETAAPANCNTSARVMWTAGTEQLSVQADSNGETCEGANVSLSIRNASGSILYGQSYAVADVKTLSDKHSIDEMNAALAQWIMPAANLLTSGSLPAWRPGTAHPKLGDLAFFVSPGVSAATYNGLRGRNAPLYCYVQSQDSTACVAYENSEFSYIGELGPEAP